MDLRFLHELATIAVAALLLAACSADSGSETSSNDLDGAALYAANCASCHGADLGGTDKGPSHLSVVYEPSHHPDEAFRSAIRNGAPQHHWDFGSMPPVTGLNDEEIDAVITFIRAEQERRGLER